MKSAEEWAKQLPMMLSEQVKSRELVKQIQLDAMKEGMRRAAEVIPDSKALFNAGQLRKAILAAAEQLTEKDL